MTQVRLVCKVAHPWDKERGRRWLTGTVISRMCEDGMTEVAPALWELPYIQCLPYSSCSKCQHLYDETQVSSSTCYDIAQMFQVTFLCFLFYSNERNTKLWFLVFCLLWFNPSWQLGPPRHSFIACPTEGWGRESNRKKNLVGWDENTLIGQQRKIK